ncbi:MAG: manganese efflux pump [Prevotella sp.]|nr:manganese efflux pump [Prevotella sp.]
MTLFDMLLLAVALAMDCFTVSIVSGVILRRREWRVIGQMSFLFGLFQAAMPFIGWICTAHFAHYVEAYDHWVAFLLLAFLGGRMIREAFLPEEQQTFNPRRLSTQLMLSVATSIDALAIGISLAVSGFTTITQLWVPLALIGLVSLLFGIAGHLLGIRFGREVSRRMKPSLIGGIILLLIGFKVLLSHLFNL